MLGLGSAHPALANPTEPGDLQNPLEAPNQCATCHAFPNAAQHADVANYSPMGWQGSMMANSARDPVFWAGVAIAAQDDPTHTEECVRCHSPRAFLEGRGDAISIGELMPPDLEGITCDLCHRMMDDGMTQAGNARYVIDDAAQDGKVPKRGPWSYGVDEPNHPWSDDVAFTASSRMCGTCHDVTTIRERVDDDGVGMGMPFNEQRTYREWLNSDFAQPGPDARTCQDCHLPAIDDVAGCSSFSAQGLTHATGGRYHDLVGANRFMLEVLAAQYGGMGMGMGMGVDEGFYEHTMERLDAFVQTAATLEVEFPDAVDLAQGIGSLPVTVTNETGHKLPSGYSEGRVMWIEVVASYAGEVVYSSGRWDAGTIEDDAQVRRYEARAEDYDDGATFHLLRNNHWVLDTRLPPRGLVPDVETDPVGDRYALDGGTWPHRDAVDYAFAPAEITDQTPGEADELTIRVRLLYLINTAEYVDFLAEENGTNAAGTDVQAMFDELGGAYPVVLASEEVTVPLSGLDEPDPSETGSTGSGASTESGTGEAGAGDGGDGGGCGCTAPGPRRPGWAAWGLLPALALVRRRRAQPAGTSR